MIKTRLNQKTYLRSLLKQRIISSFFLFAFALLMGHNVVAHHHFDEAAVTHQQDHQNDDHDEAANNFLEQAFSHFQHENKSGLIYQTASHALHCLKFFLYKETPLFTQNVIRVLFKPPLLHSTANLFIPSDYSASSLFRGPPVL